MKATHLAPVARLLTLLMTGILLAAPTHMAAASKFRILHNFTTGDDGGVPVLFAALAIDRQGDLYGADLVGGTQQNCPGSDGSGCGVVFEMTRASGGKWSEKVLYSFPSRQNADSPMALDSLGDLYGCTGDYGPMFELTPGSSQWTFSPIWTLGCQGPVGLILDGAGNLYGGFGNGGGGGLVGELSPSANGWVYTNLYDNCQQSSCGYDTITPFSWDAKGNLYGTTYFGGDPHCNCGVAFRVTPNGDGTWTYHVMHRFYLPQ